MREQILSIVIDVVSELNRELDYESLSEPDEGTVLYSGGEGIDSLSLVWLVVEVERCIQDRLGIELILASERAMSMRNSPYRSVGAFVDFIVTQLKDV